MANDDDLDQGPIVEDDSLLDMQEAVAEAQSNDNEDGEVVGYLVYEDVDGEEDEDSEDEYYEDEYYEYAPTPISRGNQIGTGNYQENLEQDDVYNEDESVDSESSANNEQPPEEFHESEEESGEEAGEEAEEESEEQEDGDDDEDEDGPDNDNTSSKDDNTSSKDGKNSSEGGDKSSKKEDSKEQESKKELKVQKEKDQSKKIIKKLKENTKKPLKAKITSIFLNPASQIPADIQQSAKETGKSIKDASKKIMKEPKIKPWEKKDAITDVSTDVAKGGAIQTGIETILKFIREALKEVIKAFSPYSWAVVAIIIAIIVVLLIMIAIMIVISGSASGAAASTEAEYMNENFTITSEYFYGLRTAYIEEEALASALKQSYQQYISDVIVEIEESGIDVKIDIITINEETNKPNPIQGDHANHYNTLTLNIGNMVAGKSELEFTSAWYNAIPYFGLSAAQQSNANSIIVDYIKQYSLYTLTTAESFPEDVVDKLDINSDLNYIETLCEKVMIKDYIATENGLTDVQQLVYVGSIYMPRTDITISDLSTVITTVTPEIPVDVSFVSKTTEETKTIASGTTSSEDGKVLMDTLENTEFNLSRFTSIDASNTEAFSTGISLIEAIRLGAIEGKDYSTYFEKVVNEDGLEIYTWKPACDNALYITYNSTNSFRFSDLLLELVHEEAA